MTPNTSTSTSNPIHLRRPIPHFVEEHEGARWSLALYQHPRVDELSFREASFLLDVGFLWKNAPLRASPTEGSATKESSDAADGGVCLAPLEMDMPFSATADLLAGQYERVAHVVLERKPDALRCAKKRWPDALCREFFNDSLDHLCLAIKDGFEKYKANLCGHRMQCWYSRH